MGWALDNLKSALILARLEGRRGLSSHKDLGSVAYVRRKTINGKTYQYLVKSVREGKRVRQIFVSYIGNPPPGSQARTDTSGRGDVQSDSSGVADFTPLSGSEVRGRYVRLLKRLGCQSVVFSLRSKHKHGDVQAQRHLETGVFEITKVRLNREADVQVIAHEVGHVLDYVLQSTQPASGSLAPEFVTYQAALRKVADYTCAHLKTSSPDYLRKIKRYPESKARNRSVQWLERYYDDYIYQDAELFARLVSVSLTEPEKAKAIAPAAYAWLKVILNRHDQIRAALTDVGLWPEQVG